MSYRLILSLPTGSSVEALTPAQHAAIGTVRGRWTAGGMPGAIEAGGRYLIDVLTDADVSRTMLDALGLWQWLIVGCWQWDGVAPAGAVVEPLDALLLASHCPDSVIPHHWAGWEWCA